MLYEFFGRTFTFTAPEFLQLLFLLPLLWVFIFFLHHRGVLLISALLRSLAVLLIVGALAGLSLQTTLAERKLAVVAAMDLSDSISAEGRTWMKGHLTRLLSAMPQEDEIAGLSFGADARLLFPPSSPATVTLPEDALTSPLPSGEGGATNIAAALERAFPLYPEGAEKRLLLFTDGNETIGEARRDIALARQMGVRIYPVIPPAGKHPEVSLEKFVVPPLVREGSVFNLRLVVRNSNDIPAKGAVQIFANDQRLIRQEVSLAPGLSVLETSSQILQRGNYHLRAEVKVLPDTVEGNNRMSATLTVAGKIRSLVITDNPKTYLARALQLKEVEVEFRRPEGVPTRLTDLFDYNCLVFDDVGRAGLSSRQMRVIEEYVRDFGGGFIMAGGIRSFGDINYKGTAVERVMPVAFQEQKPKKKKRAPVALFILIDRSNSMGYNSKVRGLHDGQKMRYAQKAAVAVISQLRDTDMVGAVAFDSEPYLIAALAPLSKSQAGLVDKIQRLQYGGGTDFYGALETAARQLARSRGTIRHIILLTDGDTNRSPSDHYPLIVAIAQQQISVTTIRIGSDTVNLQLLNFMAEKTGGRFYHVQDVEALPLLLVRDTRKALKEKGDDDRPKEVVPRVGVRGQTLQGLNEFPALEEYMVTKPKPGADVQLYVDVRGERDPILATWQYGLGKVVAVPFDPSGSGSSEWISWEGFGKFWSQVVRWVIREETPWDYRLTVLHRGKKTVLQAESFDNDEGGILLARLSGRNYRTREFMLIPVAPRLYEATLPASRPGAYPITVIRRKAGKIVNQKNEVVMVTQTVGESMEEYRQQHPNRDLLRELAEGTGGKLDPDISEVIAQRKGGTKTSIHPLERYLIPGVLLLLLLDIAVRVLAGPPV